MLIIAYLCWIDFLSLQCSQFCIIHCFCFLDLVPFTGRKGRQKELFIFGYHQKPSLIQSSNWMGLWVKTCGRLVYLPNLSAFCFHFLSQASGTKTEEHMFQEAMKPINTFVKHVPHNGWPQFVKLPKRPDVIRIRILGNRGGFPKHTGTTWTTSPCVEPKKIALAGFESIPKSSQKRGKTKIKVGWGLKDLLLYEGFPKWWYPTTMGFPTKNDHFRVFWGYHHLRKHPYIIVLVECLMAEFDSSFILSTMARVWPPDAASLLRCIQVDPTKKPTWGSLSNTTRSKTTHSGLSLSSGLGSTPSHRDALYSRL